MVLQSEKVKKHITSSLDKTFNCGQCFRWSRDGDKFIGIVNGSLWTAYESNDKLIVETTGNDTKEDIERYFDLATDYDKINQKLIEKGDNVINNAIALADGIRILNQDIFETLISFIISQNNNIPRIKKCIEKICEQYGAIIYVGEGNRKYYSFPTPEALAKADPCELQEVCRVGYRANFIVESSKRFIKEGISDISELEKYSGVGPKVANCISLFSGLSRNAFPVDVWVERMLKELYGLNMTRPNMEKWGKEYFGEYAGIAQQYLFYYIRERK